MDILSMTPAQAVQEAARRKELRAKGLPLATKIEETAGDFAVVVRSESVCKIILRGAPRTKKNHTVAHGVQSAAYRKWNADVKMQLLKFSPPLPDKPYNISAQFYVDSYGKPADLVGLMQGLADSLQAAQVVTDDKWFLGWDGTRKHETDIANPRVEILISPLASSPSLSGATEQKND